MPCHCRNRIAEPGRRMSRWAVDDVAFRDGYEDVTEAEPRTADTRFAPPAGGKRKASLIVSVRPESCSRNRYGFAS